MSWWHRHYPEADEQGYEPPDPHELADMARQEAKDGMRCRHCYRQFGDDFLCTNPQCPGKQS